MCPPVPLRRKIVDVTIINTIIKNISKGELARMTQGYILFVHFRIPFFEFKCNPFAHCSSTITAMCITPDSCYRKNITFFNVIYHNYLLF